MINSLPFNIQSLHAAYAAGTGLPDIIDEILGRIETIADPGIFLHLASRDDLLKQAQNIGSFDPETKPLWGIPFAIKDNIDAAGMPTTVACPAYAYDAHEDAFCVAALKAAGAILIGKTNLDQFATGLVGIRSPFTPPRNAVDPNLIPGGSSAGSAVAVAHGIVSFALGTDTAGSGRVPAALNNIVGLKPTLGAISASGVVPACKSLDTISILSLTVDDAYTVFQTANAFDQKDPYARKIPNLNLSPLPTNFRVGVPSGSTRRFFDDNIQAASFEAALKQVTALGGEIVEIDFTAFYEVADMLYEGAWVAERYTVIEDLLKETPEAILQTTRDVITRAESLTAADAFRGMYKLEALKAQVAPMINSVDMLCVPTVPRFYTVSEVEADPIETNSRLGTYTNFVNLLDLCGIAVPVAKRDDNSSGSITLLAPSGADVQVAALAQALHQKSRVNLGATNWPIPEPTPAQPNVTSDEIELAVVGAHMSGLPLNKELTRLGARFLRKAKTASCYKFYSLAGGPPYRPGLVCDPTGASIELETWAIPKSRFGDFIENIPQPLGIGTLTLDTKEQVKGFICETSGLEGATEITSYGGWRNFIASPEFAA